MNKIPAKVTAIERLDNLTVISLEAHKQQMRLMALGLNFALFVGDEILLGVKSSSISLAKNFEGELSISNQLMCTITAIESGSLLCSLTLSFFGTTLKSVITKASATKMQLQPNETVLALIKASDLSILELVGNTSKKPLCN